MELSIRRAGTRPVFTQRTEIVMDNNPSTKSNPMPHFPMKLLDRYLDEAGAFLLRAEVLGYPIPTVQFYKDKSDEPLITQSQLHKTAKSPCGYYELVAENCHGIVSSTAKVMPMKIIPDLIMLDNLTSDNLISLPPSGRTPSITGQMDHITVVPDVTMSGDQKSLKSESTTSSRSDIKSRKSSTSSVDGVKPSVGLTASPFRAKTSSPRKSIEQPEVTSRRSARTVPVVTVNQSSSGSSLAEIRNSLKNSKEFDPRIRPLAPNFGNSFDKGDEDDFGNGSSNTSVRQQMPSKPPMMNFRGLAPLSPSVPSHLGAPTPYKSSRAASPSDSEYYSGGYESCMETPTGSPIGSPTPNSDNVILPSESDAYQSAVENPVR